MDEPCLDPLSAYLDGIDSHNHSEVRSALALLADIAERTGAAILCISHPNKSDGGEIKALNRLNGSAAFGAAPRSVMAVAHDPERKEEGRRLLLPVKLNVAALPAGLGYRIVAASPTTCESSVCWDQEPVTVDADEALTRRPVDSDEMGEAKQFLQLALADGEWHAARDLIDEAAERVVSEKTLQRARKKLGVEYRKEGFAGGWRWRLPQETT
jgi:AAA domain